ncbi:esterase-like activity of phytase family protein [Motilibacter deserti]|uniref:Esterase-like activity of phytase family protein n=1 Tax=Motilibacter deserti TaxID=2714956 RepID=A0ABX0GV87_9ACTN|nr:esterase-like activity of phytase family protein [Motilibacter deserti]NHC14839.1 esterase-like activity of phytase family protein [Motilibacter deserti]
MRSRSVVAVTAVMTLGCGVGAAVLGPSATGADGSLQQAELVARTVLPADTFGEALPSGALASSANGRTTPFAAQPVQGFSGVLPQQDGTYWVLSDNGFGTKANSADFILRVQHVKPDYVTGKATVVDLGIDLEDPDRKVPFPLTRADRRLTGADFDIESFRQAPDGTLWFGDEFGPWLIHTDANGKVLEAPFHVPGVASPSDPTLPAGATPNLANSKGFEGMALSDDGKELYPMLEGPVTGDSPQDLRVYKFNLRHERFQGIAFRYRLESTGNAIGDLTAIDDHRYVVIERDNGEGATARFKAVFLVDDRDKDKDGYADKTLLVNLLAVPDPNGVAGAKGSFFSFPFQTIEGIAVLDDHTLLIENDNNYPGSAGRTPGSPDDNEFIKVRLDRALTD